MIELNIDGKEIEIDHKEINNEEELKRLNDELNKKGHIEFDIKD